MKARNWAILPALFGVLLTIGCSHSDSSSPSAPTAQTGGSTSSGATINGLLSGGAAASSNRLTALTTTGLTVTINGTNASALVDNGGRFSLTGVPAGDVQLRFSGPGTNATLTITGVQNGDQIQLTITLSGGTASLESSLREGAERRVEVEGTVTSVSCPSIMVNGVKVVTNTSTQFVNGSCASIKTGMKIEAKGTRQADGSLLASRVNIGDAEDHGNEDQQQQGQVELEGAITAATGCASFTVNGVMVTTNATTVFRNGVCSDIKIGVKVDVTGTRAANGSIVASRVDVDKEDDERDEAEVEGAVTTANGCASFVVKGVTVTTNASTVFRNGVCADIKVGLKVDVTGTRAANGSIAASRVEIERD